MPKYYWYEKFFYRLQLKEKKYFRLVFYLILFIFMVQVLLSFPVIRKFLVLTERFEGEPAGILQKF